MSEQPLGDQTSLSLGGGRPPSVLTNFRTGTAKEQAEAMLEVGMEQIPYVRALEVAWVAAAPQAPSQVPATAPPAQAVTHQQGVANATAGLGATPVTTPPPSSRPPHGSLHPTKFCPDCAANGSQTNYKVADTTTKSGPNAGKPYRKLYCPIDNDHKADWSETYGR